MHSRAGAGSWNRYTDEQEREHRDVLSLVPIVTFAAAVMAQGAAAPGCTTTISRVGLAPYAGLVIRSVDVDPRPPASLPGVPESLDRVHALTRPATIRRELRFAAGDSVDTLAIAESLRQLRALGFLADVQLMARTCTDSAGVAITVVTRDAWSERPILSVRTASYAIGFTELNTLGSGRATALSMRSDAEGSALAASVRDPTLADGRMEGQVGAARYLDGGTWYGAVRSRDRSFVDPWIGNLSAFVSERGIEGGVGTILDRTRLSARAGHRVTGPAAPSAMYVELGAEEDDAHVVWSQRDPMLGSRVLVRRFVAGDVAVARRATRFDTLAWLLPGDGIVDVPRGSEGTLVVGLGHDLADDRAKAHVAGWAGRMWKLGERGLVVGDVWTSGYVAPGLVQDGSARASLLAVAPASHGLWSVRVAGERLVDPDPNVRALATVDPVAALLPRESRLASTAIAADVERSRHVWAVTRGSMLDAALFVAPSYRFDPASVVAHQRLGATFLGAGLRLTPGEAAGPTVRLDVGYPVFAMGAIRRRPAFAVSITPWVLAGRRLDENR